MPILRFFALLFFLAAVYKAAAEEPLKIEPSQDTTLFSTKEEPGGENWGKRPTMRLMADPDHYRPVLRFDFKDAAARPCLAAILRLTAPHCWPSDKLQYIRIHRLLRPFNEHHRHLAGLLGLRSMVQPGRRFLSRGLVRPEIDQRRPWR